MNRFLITILVVLNFQVYAQEKVVLEKPTIDKRVELLSVVFRLAEKPEYSSKQFKLYAEKIERHFEKHKNHELIQFTKSIMNERGIGYDAVMSMAIHLDDNLKLLTKVTDIWQRETHWNKENAERFVSLLQQFAKETKFDDFFKDNADLYNETVKRITPVYEQVNFKWYHTFFGKELSETFLTIMGLGNGGGNYGVSLEYANGNRKVYAIMGVGRTDNEGMPVFDTSTFFTLLHEFNHSFVNNLIEKDKDLLRESGEKIFSVVKNQMANQAYRSWETVLNEALVRASVIKYGKDHNFRQPIIDELIKREKTNGFFWIEDLVNELESYDKQRDKYPTLESYIPQLIGAYKSWSGKVPNLERPKVISISEFTNGSMNVSADTKTITVNFSMPLSDKGYSVYIGNKGRDAFPKVEKINYANNNQSVVMHVSLEKDKEYQFVLVGKNFTSVDGIGIEDYEVNFKTGK